MQDMQPWEDWRSGPPWLLPLGGRAAFGGVVLCLALAAAGCSSISTPLPDLKPSVTSSMSQKDRQKAMDELNRKRDTHEEDAEREIEEQR